MAMEEFKVVSDLPLNIGKCGVVLKGQFCDMQQERIQDLGIALKESVRFLGVQVGNVTVAWAFAKALGEAE